MNVDTSKKNKNSNKRLLYLLIIILLVAVFLGIMFIFPGNRVKTDSNRVRVNSIPIILDNYTRIDSIFEIGSERIEYYMTINVSEEDIDLSKNANIIVDNIIESIRHDKDYDKWIAHKIVFEYKYYDKQGKLFFMKTLTPEMYKRP